MASGALAADTQPCAEGYREAKRAHATLGLLDVVLHAALGERARFGVVDSGGGAGVAVSGLAHTARVVDEPIAGLRMSSALPDRAQRAD